MKKILAVSSFLTFTIASIISFLHINNIFHVGQLTASIFWWLFVVEIFIFALYKKSLTTWILVAMVIGIRVGFDFKEIALNLGVLSKVFLKLIKTVIGPILFSTLVVGIAGHANLKQLGRMGWKSLLYFEVVTTLALAIGVIAINVSQAGVGVTLPEGYHHDLPATVTKTWQDHILDIFPENIAKAVAEGQVLPIVVFSIIFGIGLAMLSEEKRRPMLQFSESLAETMFKFTNIIMYFAPFGVGAAIAHATAELGVDILFALLRLLLTLYVALLVFVTVVLGSVMAICKIPVLTFLKAVREPVSIAFATTSSESALPKAMENMERIGVPRKIVAFVLPTGYTFNLDGTTLYLSLAAIFVAQAANIPMTLGEQLILVFTLMLTSKGVAGVPRASLVILIGAAAAFKLPLWPIMAILGIDELMDMARTSVNVFGNCLASCVVARWEGELDDAKLHAPFHESDESPLRDKEERFIDNH
ncbi:dicarboxylate/amino acid:cation symporter [Taibaiella chishuiensis]|uniref:Proton glutamate symport protein n=1 Tax=Taibaiella chishuiensis TaxID=1434707 RepID=A0A2P8D4C8_9BACT|nr:cation:dicarboxylase symporter family transporter [Taibaiella chishuiensis]PSK92071.1 proton glutamate symport protein [Taibaiella chishuiensis]